MKFQKSCRFCSIANGQYNYSKIDEPFFSNDKYMAVASIGAFIEGWTLIIPKKHMLSMQSAYMDPALNDLLEYIYPILLNKYGPLIAFEHGANEEDSITACGVNHAHLHIVPFGSSLLPDIASSGLNWDHCHISEIISKAGGNEYLFYTELSSQKSWHNAKGELHILGKPLSQFFRKLIAKRSGELKSSNYKLFPFLENAIITRRNLTSLVA